MLKRFLPYYKPYRGLLALDLGAALSLALIDLVFPSATRRVVDVLVPSGDARGLVLFALALGALYALRSVLEYVVGFYGHVLGVNIQRDMRRDIFRQLHRLDARFFDDTKTGQIMSRVVGDLFDIAEFSHHAPEDLLVASVRLVGSFLLMLAIEWRLALVVCAVIPVQALYTYGFRGRFRRAFRAAKETMAAINERLEESVAGSRVVRAFGNEDHEQRLFDAGNEKFRAARVESVRHIGVFNAGDGFLSFKFSLAVYNDVVLRDRVEREVAKPVIGFALPVALGGD